MTFSILVAHFNNATFFKDCYESLINQTVSDFEVIILDDCSKESEFNTVQEIINNDSRFKIYKNEKNEGVGYTKRKLIDLSNGDLCAFLDPDDTLYPTAIEKMIEAHIKHPNASIISSNLMKCNELLEPITIVKRKQVENNQPTFFNVNGDISHFAVFKKTFYLKTSGIDPYFRIAEDQDLYLKLYEVGASIHIDDVLYNYRTNPHSLTNASAVDVSRYWHWVAAIKAAERRGINIENQFVENFVNRKELIKKKREIQALKNTMERIKKSRWLKLGFKLGFFKIYKQL